MLSRLLPASAICVAQAGEKADPGFAAAGNLAIVSEARGAAMSAAPVHKPIVHFVGSIPLPDARESLLSTAQIRCCTRGTAGR